MEKIIWDSEKHSVGHPLLDEQHQQLVRLINELVDQDDFDFTSRAALDLFMAFSDYADNHFATEEEILRTLDVPDLDAHIALHNSYNQKVQGCMMRTNQDNIRTAIEFMTDWWINHILKEDRQYKPLFEKM